MPRILRTGPAQQDLAELWHHIARDNPRSADHLLGRIERKLLLLTSSPLAGRAVLELDAELRVTPVGAYLIYYRPLSDGVIIVRVLHGARLMSPELFD